MIHMELGPSTIVGVGLALIGFILYFVKTKKPDVSRDYDLFFSSVGLLCGGILIFQGWRLDPILLLCQILSSATAIFFIGESLWLRSTKSKSGKFFPSGVPYRKKQNTLLPIEPLGAFRVLKKGGSLSFQDSGEKNISFPDFYSQDVDLLQEAFIPAQAYPTKGINELNQEYVFSNEKRILERKIEKYYQFQKLSVDFEYTQPIDYCNITFSVRD